MTVWDCDVCGRETPVLVHEFRIGVLPSKVGWDVNAPAYYKSSPDGRSAVEGYCSPECSGIGHKP